MIFGTAFEESHVARLGHQHGRPSSEWIGLGCHNPPLCGMEHPGRIGGQMRCQERLGPTWSDGRESKEGSVGIKSSRETFPKAEERSDYSPHTLSCVCVHAQLRPTLWDPMDCSPSGPPIQGIFRQEYWSELSFPSPGDLPDPGIEPHISFVSCIGHQVL